MSTAATAPTTAYSPTPRDEAIYRAVKIEGLSQTQVAADLGIDQSTVSRALQRFALWRATTDPQESGDLTLRQQQRIDRWLARERHEQVYSQALRFARRMQEPALTTRQGHAGDKAGDKHVTHEIKKDQHAAAARFIRIAQRSADALHRLAEKSPINEEPLEEYTIRDALVELRERAEASGSIPKSENPYLVIIRWLAALLGRQPPAHPPELLAPGSPLGEIVRTAMSQCFAGSPEDHLRNLADNPPPRDEEEGNFEDGYETADPTLARSASEESFEPDASSDSRPAPLPMGEGGRRPGEGFQCSTPPSEEPETHTEDSCLKTENRKLKTMHATHNCITPPSPTSVDPTITPSSPTPSPQTPSAPPKNPSPLANLEPDENENHFQAYSIFSNPNDPLGQLYRRLEKQIAAQEFPPPRKKSRHRPPKSS